MYSAMANLARVRVSKRCRWYISFFRVAKNDSAAALSQHTPVRPTLVRTRRRRQNAANCADVYWAQYTYRAFAAACHPAGVRQSMSPIGSSADNAAAESFNATFKRETLPGRRAFTSEHEALLTALRWLHRYNTVRRHSRLGQRSPNRYENDHQTTSTTLAPAA
jgi:transposase InsO family protein